MPTFNAGQLFDVPLWIMIVLVTVIVGIIFTHVRGVENRSVHCRFAGRMDDFERKSSMQQAAVLKVICVATRRWHSSVLAAREPIMSIIRSHITDAPCASDQRTDLLWLVVGGLCETPLVGLPNFWSISVPA